MPTQKQIKEMYSEQQIVDASPETEVVEERRSVFDFCAVDEVLSAFEDFAPSEIEIECHWDDADFVVNGTKALCYSERYKKGLRILQQKENQKEAKQKKEEREKKEFERLKRKFGE